MKIVDFTVDGIRESASRGLVEWLRATDADIYALHDLRADAETVEEILFCDLDDCLSDYYLIYDESCKDSELKTAILTKLPCKNVRCNIPFNEQEEWQDADGRVIVVEFDNFTFTSALAHNGEQPQLKYEFVLNLFRYCVGLVADNKESIIAVDTNIAHTGFDVSNIVGAFRTKGFLSYERDLITRFLGKGYFDAYRTLHPGTKAYTWSDYENSTGITSRLSYRYNYIFTTFKLNRKLTSCQILNAPISHHLPVLAEYDIQA